MGAQAVEFERLVRGFGERAFRFAYRLSGNADDAKDLTQEAFYRVLRNWSRYDPAQPLEGWLITILRHVFLDWRKRYDRRRAVSLNGTVQSEGENLGYDEVLPGDEEAILASLERKAQSDAVRDALEGLRPRHRAVLTLCDMEGLSYEESSRILEVPVGTVRSRLSRARAALRARLAGRVEFQR